MGGDGALVLFVFVFGFVVGYLWKSWEDSDDGDNSNFPKFS